MATTSFGWKNESLDLKSTFHVNQIYNVTKEVESPVSLKVARFAKCPKLSFQKLEVGQSKTLDLLLNNPNADVAIISTDNLPEDSDFKILPSDEISYEEGLVITLQPSEVKKLTFQWNPKSVGNVRQVVSFKWEGGHKLQAILLGQAVSDGRKKVAIYHITLSSSANDRPNNISLNRLIAIFHLTSMTM